MSLGERSEHEADRVRMFDETWQAEAFALVQLLVDDGVFTPGEWSAALAGAIADAQRAGDPDLGDTYYNHWARALESLCTAKAMVTAATLDRRLHAWRSAYERTPHGQPVELTAADPDLVD